VFLDEIGNGAPPIPLSLAPEYEAMRKSRGEVLVTGKAFPPGGAAAIGCAARVQLGAVDKRQQNLECLRCERETGLV
jgi:hypothetical protein